MAQFLIALSSLLAVIIGLWKFLRGKAAERQKQAEQAGKDLENAEKNDSASDFIDAFSKLR
jgi:hypothetical protein